MRKAMWSRRRTAFTLIELVVVIVILGILAAVAIPKYVDLSDKAKEASCKAQRGVVATATTLYYASLATHNRTPAYPTTYNTPGLYADGQPPSCPSGGTWTYDQTTGRVTCSVHGS